MTTKLTARDPRLRACLIQQDREGLVWEQELLEACLAKDWEVRLPSTSA